MVLITALGRCGTSVLTLFYKNLGFNVGSGGWYDDINAGLEDVKVQTIHLYLYYMDKAADEGKVRCCLEELRNCHVLKDPRILWKPEVLKYWKDVYGSNLKVILLHRDVKAIAASRAKIVETDAFLSIPNFDDPFALLRMYYNMALELVFRKIPFSYLTFPGFLEDYDYIYRMSNAMGLEFDKEEGRKVWNETVDFSKVHYK